MAKEPKKPNQFGYNDADYVKWLEKENEQLHVFRDMAYYMSSFKYEEIEDYIRVVKQAIADYEAAR